MKCIRLAAIVMAFLLTQCMYASLSAAEGVYLTDSLKTSLTSEELRGHNISGMCFGKDSVCVYTTSSFVILDTKAQWKTAAVHEINHPHIRTDAPYIKQVIYEERGYHLLVFDHETSKSYIATWHDDQTDYGELYAKEIHSFALMSDGFFLTGIDEKQQQWHAGVDVTGNALWELHSESKNLNPIYCTAINEGFLVVGESSSEPSIFISIISDAGTELSLNEICPSDVAGISSYQIFQVDCTNNNIAICGTRMSKSSQAGFILRLDQACSIISYREYSQFARIQSLVNTNDHYIMLALAGIDSFLPNKRYIISESTDYLFPLEQNGSIVRSLGLGKDENNLTYLYGMIDESVVAPDGFIVELNIE